VASCAGALLKDLSAVDPALERTAYARGLARRAELLRKGGAPVVGPQGRAPRRAGAGAARGGAALAGRRADRGLPALRRARAAGLSRHGGELFSLLGRRRGVPARRARRADGLRQGPAVLGPDRPLPRGERTCSPRTASRPGAGGRALLGGLEAQAGPRLRPAHRRGQRRPLPAAGPGALVPAVRARLRRGRSSPAKPAQSKNPYLCALVDGASEQLQLLRGGSRAGTSSPTARPRRARA
jgi:hypothetical protein